MWVQKIYSKAPTDFTQKHIKPLSRMKLVRVNSYLAENLKQIEETVPWAQSNGLTRFFTKEILNTLNQLPNTQENPTIEKQHLYLKSFCDVLMAILPITLNDRIIDHLQLYKEKILNLSISTYTLSLEININKLFLVKPTKNIKNNVFSLVREILKELACIEGKKELITFTNEISTLKDFCNSLLNLYNISSST